MTFQIICNLKTSFFLKKEVKLHDTCMHTRNKYLLCIMGDTICHLNTPYIVKIPPCIYVLFQRMIED